MDILLWFFGEPDSVSAVKRRLYSNEVDDYFHAVMSFKSGLKGHMDTCWSIRSFRLPEISIEIHGKKGTLTVTDDFVRLETKQRTTSIPPEHKYTTSSLSTAQSPSYWPTQNTPKEDEAFLRAENQPTSPNIRFLRSRKSESD